nr:hypothetical protein [Tanacetum cinerariifolium]
DEDSNSLDAYNWSKGFLKVNSLLLSISLGHQPCLIFQNITILIKLNFVNPLESYNHDTVWLRVIQATKGIGCKLFSSGYQSRWVANDVINRVILALFSEMMKCLSEIDDGVPAELTKTGTARARETGLSTRGGSRITEDTKVTEKGKIRLFIMHQLIWGFVMTSVNKGSVLSVTSSSNSFCPKKNQGLKKYQHCPSSLNESTVLSFNNVVLLWSHWN